MNGNILKPSLTTTLLLCYILLFQCQVVNYLCSLNGKEFSWRTRHGKIVKSFVCKNCNASSLKLKEKIENNFMLNYLLNEKNQMRIILFENKRMLRKTASVRFWKIRESFANENEFFQTWKSLEY